MRKHIQRISARAKAVPIHHWIFLAILLFGIFLRTYEFRDWMIFNPDQARDAFLIQDMIDGKTFPLMGPQAGNTEFSLGPIFYYFEFASALVFGSSVESMAYPDLFFSILAIVLAHFFFRKFFQENIALILTFLFSISFFVITYSRFAFNPNSIPFFVLLFLLALLKIMSDSPKEKFFWAAVLGVSMGVGFQLHTILLISMPAMAVLVCAYLFFKRRFIWKSMLVAFLFFLLCNAGQLSSEVQNDWFNMKVLFSDMKGSGLDSGKSQWRSIANDTLCHIQGMVYILSAQGGGDKCEFTTLPERIGEKGWLFNLKKVVFIGIGAIFLSGGWALLFWYASKERSRERMYALWLLTTYCLVTFMVLLPVSSAISMRYFIVVEFVPFVLAGFWIRFIGESLRHTRVALASVSLFVFILTALHLQAISMQVHALASGTASTKDFAIFGETKVMSRYILDRSGDAEVIYLHGRTDYLSRFDASLNYFAAQEGKVVRNANHRELIGRDDPFFYIANKGNERLSSKEIIEGFSTEEISVFGNVAIAKIVRK